MYIYTCTYTPEDLMFVYCTHIYNSQENEGNVNNTLCDSHFTPCRCQRVLAMSPEFYVPCTCCIPSGELASAEGTTCWARVGRRGDGRGSTHFHTTS